MLINYTNHPSALWGEAQRRASACYGPVIDRAFPDVPAAMTEAEVQQLARREVQAMLDSGATAVLCQGEFTLCFLVVHLLLAQGICVLAACSERLSHEEHLPDGTVRRTSEFLFCQYRCYSLPVCEEPVLRP